ncbi:fumarylacetoacetate hydrolase family protein [Sphingomonas sp. CL5.1]|uniref:fumarylacetoacetate hydrolase family protein n=1 Tax=Sphingomonas sp. CL5.1 TaxID=2653203 RepID=UPI001583FAFA|nr:fumarylacetoacetate hydrolase family protein [Sphingomonas sp. CL5.1]QKR99934.1 fumarylacetoacetate hydrolase family protein [Sphingomonas sp. CL5.1]
MTEGAAAQWAIAPDDRPCVTVADGSTFPVHRIWCVGRNYSEHAREMGGDPTREPPFFFAKPADAVVPSGSKLRFPRATDELHHEVELVVAIGGHGSDLSPEEARRLIFGYAVGLDMTRRDRQAEAKATARPWEIGKAFDQSCPISEIRLAAETGDLAAGAITLSVNGAERQSGDLADMIWSPAECIAALSRIVDVFPGDLILTGTPAGVGPVVAGDTLRATCEGVGELSITYER